ncbi:MAG: hypothetical protein J3Q66DRAFT_133392 [Benniella sp.]|nr:MAG: hypothetical protein J3Q66DRAFT_133392 [Benniella sp.]
MNHSPPQGPEATGTDAPMNQPQQQQQQGSNTTAGTATSETVIAVDQTVPTIDSVTPDVPYVFPVRRDNEPNDSDRISVNCDEEVQRPISPPFRGDPAPAFRYLGRTFRGDYTPSVRSALLPGHQQSSRPYSSSIRNEYQPPLGGHRPEGHLQGYRDTGKSMVIDYAGLDASITEASLIENGFQKTTFVEPTNDTKDMHGSKTLERAASTGSSVLMASSPGAQSEFRRRSARKASFYSERAPRVGEVPL